MKVKTCTSLEQSKRLVELGLSSETADMCYFPVLSIENNVHYNLFAHKEKVGIPAWSLSALLKLMPQFTLNGFCNGKFNCRDERADNYALVDSNPLDAAYSMVVNLIEQGYIKTEKK